MKTIMHMLHFTPALISFAFQCADIVVRPDYVEEYSVF